MVEQLVLCLYLITGFVLLRNTAIAKLYSHHCTVQSCGSEFSNFNHLGRVQRITTRPVRGQINLFLLGWRCPQDDLNLAFKIFKGYFELCPSDFFLRPPRAGLREHTFRLLQGPGRLWQRIQEDCRLSLSCLSIHKLNLIYFAGLTNRPSWLQL